MSGAHFDDLTKINVPFGLLDDDTKARLKAEKGYFQVYDNFVGWKGIYRPTWAWGCVYRIKPMPVEETQVHDMQMATYGHNIIACVSTSGQIGSNWINGKLTINTVDGKPVSATWVAY